MGALLTAAGFLMFGLIGGAHHGRHAGADRTRRAGVEAAPDTVWVRDTVSVWRSPEGRRIRVRPGERVIIEAAPGRAGRK